MTKWFLSFGFAFLIIGIPLMLGNLVELPLTQAVPGLARLAFLENDQLYLLHHLFSAGPVIFFGIVLNLYGYRRVFFNEFLKPIFLLSLVFISWDYFFNRWGVWGFNPKYLSGYEFLGLPLEELLWFYLIPMCSLFIYHLCESKCKIPGFWDRGLELVAAVAFLVFYIVHIDKAYSVVSCGASLVVLFMGRLWPVPGFAVFFVSFLMNLLPMYVFNGMLTGLFTEEALVQYNAGEFSGMRWGSYPLEDIGFGFAYLYGIAILRQKLKSRISASYTV